MIEEIEVILIKSTKFLHSARNVKFANNKIIFQINEGRKMEKITNAENKMFIQ